MRIHHEKIPEGARRVFEGIRCEVYQWDQEMYDGSVEVFERVRYLDGAFVVPILPNGRILLTRQTQPGGRSEFVSLPGGAIEHQIDEVPEVCAMRELLEETGYATDESLIPWLRFDGTSNVMAYTYFLIARNCYKKQEMTPDPGERISLFDVSFDEFLELSSDRGFHHHWNLLPIFYEARLSESKKDELKKIFYEK